MANYSVLNKSISKFLWAYVFILFQISIGPADILPDFIGYILMAAGILSLTKELEHSNVLKPLVIFMCAWSAFSWITHILSVSSVILTYISSAMGIVNIILNFLLLTDLSDICREYQSDRQKLDKKLLTARNIYVFCTGASILSGLLLLLISDTAEILIALTVVVSVTCIILFIVVMVLLFKGLWELKKITDVLTANSQNCCVPFTQEDKG